MSSISGRTWCAIEIDDNLSCNPINQSKATQIKLIFRIQCIFLVVVLHFIYLLIFDSSQFFHSIQTLWKLVHHYQYTFLSSIFNQFKFHFKFYVSFFHLLKKSKDLQKQSIDREQNIFIIIIRFIYITVVLCIRVRRK